MKLSQHGNLLVGALQIILILAVFIGVSFASPKGSGEELYQY